MPQTMYAHAAADDLDDHGGAHIRILTDPAEPETEIDVVGYEADDDEALADAAIYAALADAGYRRVGSTQASARGLIIPVEHATTDQEAQLWHV